MSSIPIDKSANHDFAAKLLQRGDAALRESGSSVAPRSGWIILLAIVVWILQATACWASGFREYQLHRAIEQGVVEIDARERLNHDTSVASAKRETQRASMSFWRQLTEITDFVLEPLALLLRFWVIPLAVSAANLLVGRNVAADKLRYCVAVSLLAALPRPGFELLSAMNHWPEAAPGLNLLIPAKMTIPAGLYQALAQADLFWITSIFLMTCAMWRMKSVARGPMVCSVASVFLLEWSIRLVLVIVAGSAMRETLIPPEPFTVGRGPGP
jgi:hypothetical protein